jgi:uncharacterized membrane protein YkvI
MNRRWVTSVLMPAAVFQSVIVGGAYGTGREVAEFVSRFGPWGGLGVIALAGVGFGVILAVSFELARITRCFDYRRFLRGLLGAGWILYEIMFVLLLLIVLAVTGAAAGKVLAETFALDQRIGIALMLAAVVLTTYCGRRLVEVTLTTGAILLTSVIVLVCVSAAYRSGAEIVHSFATASTPPGWATSALVFVLYNSALAPVLLYVAVPLENRREALSAGFAAGFAGVLPALLFHLAFMSAYPAIIDAEIPTYWLIKRLEIPLLLGLYVCVLFMTIVQTGVGVLQGVNERLDNWWRERHGKPFSALQHGLVAAAAVIGSLLLAKLGIVKLVAQGYGSLAWGFLFVYTVPVLTLGVARIIQHTRQHTRQSARQYKRTI